MSDLATEILLGIATALVTALIMVPMFVAMKLLLDAGLVVLFAVVVSFGVLVAILLRHETTR